MIGARVGLALGELRTVRASRGRGLTSLRAVDIRGVTAVWPEPLLAAIVKISPVVVTVRLEGDLGAVRRERRRVPFEPWSEFVNRVKLVRTIRVHHPDLSLPPSSALLGKAIVFPSGEIDALVLTTPGPRVRQLLGEVAVRVHRFQISEVAVAVPLERDGAGAAGVVDGTKPRTRRERVCWAPARRKTVVASA